MDNDFIRVLECQGYFVTIAEPLKPVSKCIVRSMNLSQALFYVFCCSRFTRVLF